MNAEKYLQFMMDFYEYASRQKCLDQLFCVIGNGYHWENGNLMEDCPDERASRWVLTEDIVHAEPSSLVVELQEIKDNVLKVRYGDEKYEQMKKKEKWYQISEKYSYICNYPEDIQPDWLALINECKEMLKADGIEVPENRP